VTNYSIQVVGKHPVVVSYMCREMVCLKVRTLLVLKNGVVVENIILEIGEYVEL
jgi:hypothetical protein